MQIHNIFKNDKKNHKIFVTYEGYHWEKVFFGITKNSNSINYKVSVKKSFKRYTRR